MARTPEEFRRDFENFDFSFIEMVQGRLPIFMSYNEFKTWVDANRDMSIGFMRRCRELSKICNDAPDEIKRHDMQFGVMVLTLKRIADIFADAMTDLDVPMPEDLQIDIFGRIVVPDGGEG